MDLFDVVRSCARRWYVLLPLLLIVGVYSHSVYSSVKPVYFASTVLGLAPPSNRVEQATPGYGIPRNGLLDIGGATLVANLASVGLRQPAVIHKVVEAGGLPSYVAYLMPSPGGGQLPLISVDVTNADKEAVSRTLEIVIAQADETLKDLQRQARVPDDQMVTTFVVSPPSTPAAGMPSRTRSTIAVFVAGFGLSVLVTVLADVLLTRRRQRKDALRDESPADEPGPASEPADTPESTAAEPADTPESTAAELRENPALYPR